MKSYLFIDVTKYLSFGKIYIYIYPSEKITFETIDSRKNVIRTIHILKKFFSSLSERIKNFRD